MKPYLAATDVIDWHHPEIARLARELSAGGSPKAETAKRCFEWVRDQVQHSGDCQRGPVTCNASDVLKHRIGLCYAKSHLLAALLRANGIPTALCYQRIKLDEQADRWCLHGLNAVFLAEIGWYRVNARGNKPGVDAQFNPPVDALAFPAVPEQVVDVEGRFDQPLLEVVKALTNQLRLETLLHNLPDLRAIPMGG